MGVVAVGSNSRRSQRVHCQITATAAGDGGGERCLTREIGLDW